MFEYDHHYYSVPYTYYKQEVTLKASYFDIIICDSMNHLSVRISVLINHFQNI